MPGTNENNLDAYNEVATALGGAGGHLNDMVAVRAIAVLEGVSGGPADVSDDNMVLRLNAIDVGAGGPGGHLNTLDALNSIVVLKGGVGGHENDLDAINEWVDFVGVSFPLDDVTGAEAAYSAARRLTSVSWGTVDSVLDPIVRLIRDSDSAEMTFSYGSNNELDTAAIITFLGGASGDFVKIYDQTGNGHHRDQATASQQPLYVASGIGSKPAMDFTRSDSQALGGAVTSLTLAFTLYMVFRVPTLVDGQVGTLVGSQGGARRFFRIQDENTLNIRPDDFNTLFDVGALTIDTNYVGVFKRDASDNLLFFESGNDTTVGSPTNTETVGFGAIGASGPLGDALFFDGRLAEIIYYQADHVTADRETLEDNIGAFYGIAIS